ncbi:putative methyltransferase YcgJ [compost metagenome]
MQGVSVNEEFKDCRQSYKEGGGYAYKVRGFSTDGSRRQGDGAMRMERAARIEGTGLSGNTTTGGFGGMGLYDRHVLPHLIDFACGMGDVMKQRAQLVPRAEGRVLEIGMGTGLNLGFYDPEKVSTIVGVDPAAQMQRLCRRRAESVDIPVEMVALELGEIQAPEASFDSIVCTFTLCSIPDAVAALREMRRVLKPGGKLLFCEHGLAPDAGVRTWQHRLTPWWKPLAGGCHLDRDMPALIASGGFRIRELSEQYLPGPRPMTYVYRGVAE